ncbi:MAG: inositol monophosphatase family protein [Pseudomonadota bacterium]
MLEDFSTELDAARAAAGSAREIIMRYFKANAAVQTKEDRTPVTVADIESEAAIRKILTQAFPDHGFYGEESGQSDIDAEYLWLVDPIDGTRSFVREYPFFSTQIALMHQGELVLGVSSAPAFDELAWAVKGQGAFLNGEALKVSEIADLADSAISTGNLKTMTTSHKWQVLGDIIGEVARNRGYGDFYHYHLLAAGKIEAVIESDLNILDIAALTVIVREAGGIVSELDGSAIGLDTSNLLAANPELYPGLLQRLNNKT